MKRSSLHIIPALWIAGIPTLQALPYQVDLIAPAGGEEVFIEIAVPGGVTPTALSHDGIFDSQNRTMKWGPLSATEVSSIGFEIAAGSGSLGVTSYPAGATVSASITVKSDSDGDGLSDDFEATYGVSTPTADDDGDGFDNLTEQRLGTDPTDAASRLFARSVSEDAEAGVVEIRVPAEIGVAGLKVDTSPVLTNVIWRGVEFTARVEGSDLVIEIQTARLTGEKNFFRVIR